MKMTIDGLDIEMTVEEFIEFQKAMKTPKLSFEEEYELLTHLRHFEVTDISMEHENCGSKLYVTVRGAKH